MPLLTKGNLKQISIAKNLTDSDGFLKHAALKFSESREYDIFLSHSYLDKDEIVSIISIIEDLGFSVYIDWIEDKQLDRSEVTQETADILRKRMNQCKSLLFATSQNSPDSKWMPWELGYFDGLKGKVAILPIVDEANQNEYAGQEYLGLYYYVTFDVNITSGQMDLWINKNSNVYTIFKRWIDGEELS